MTVRSDDVRMVCGSIVSHKRRRALRNLNDPCVDPPVVPCVVVPRRQGPVEGPHEARRWVARGPTQGMSFAQGTDSRHTEIAGSDDRKDREVDDRCWGHVTCAGSTWP